MLILGKYEIVEEVGRGGMGIVYRAIDNRLSRSVAIKELVVSDLIIGQDKSEIIARFKQEAQTAALLNHPNIITIYDVGEENGRHFIAMEFLSGKSLKDYLDEGYKYTNIEIIDILIQIASGLEHAHLKGVIHRDIKPDNMKMLEGNVIKVTDFGIARIESNNSGLTQDGTMLGTLGYISPEQLHNSKGVDSRADIFSFGAMMYELFTKKLPFDGGTVGNTILKIMTELPVAPRKINSEIPEHVEKIILKCLEKNPETRYQKFKDVIEDLNMSKLMLKNPALMAQPATEARKTTPGSIEDSYSNMLKNNNSGVVQLNQPVAPPPKPLMPQSQSQIFSMNSVQNFQKSTPFEPVKQPQHDSDMFQKVTPLSREAKNPYSNMLTNSAPPNNYQKPVMHNTSLDNTNSSGFSNVQKSSETPEMRVMYVRSIGRGGVSKGQFSGARGLCYSNSNGFIFVADTQNRRVQAFDSFGTWQFLLQTPEMTSPAGIAVDVHGKVYVVDSTDCKVRVFDNNGSLINSFASKGTGHGQLKSATGIAVASDKVYVVDNENFRINIFNANGTYQSYLGKYGEKPCEYKNPYSVAADSSRIYILDYGLARVQVIDKDGISRAVFGQRGTLKAQFSIPKGIAVDKFGRIYVCDTLNHRVQIFDKTGKWLYSFGNKGSEQGQFMGPEGISVSNDGNIFVLDKGNNRVQVFTYEV